jgi:hypothetical protein
LNSRFTIAIVAEAQDLPADFDSMKTYGYRSSRFGADCFAVVPAAVTWSVARLHGNTVVSPTTVVDFRQRVPSNESFWQVYARGTYQNRARIGNRTHGGIPGRYLFLLTRGVHKLDRHAATSYSWSKPPRRSRRLTRGG